MLKSDIRRAFKAKRKLLTHEEKKLQSENIAHIVASNFNLTNKVVSIFLPIERLNEIDTSFVVEQLKKSNSTISTSISNFNDLSLKHVIYDDNTILKDNEWGIPEPINGDEVDPNVFDIVFVPLLACDKRGYRVGYGKGFYDRFLSQCRNDTVFVGLNYFESLVEIDDANIDDVPIHFLVTPNKILKF